MQLIDGGYAEGSGLNALSDYSPEVVRRVAKRNAVATGTEGDPIIVPLRRIVPTLGMIDITPIVAWLLLSLLQALVLGVL